MNPSESEGRPTSQMDEVTANSYETKWESVNRARINQKCIDACCCKQITGVYRESLQRHHILKTECTQIIFNLCYSEIQV